MMGIWSGIDQAKILDAAAPMRRAGDKLVNGPKLDGDAGHASQLDIDTIFN
jgi:chemotaxis protein CheZ